VVNPIRTPRLELIAFDPEAIRLLVAGDRDQAELVLGLALPSEFPSAEEVGGFLTIQLQRMRAAANRREWMARMMIAKPNLVVGHCGFHGPPDVIGRAEIGYTVFEAFRGQGYAREAAGALIALAFERGEREVYATVSPANAPSLAIVKSLGFKQVGTQEDEIDGLELVFVIQAHGKIARP
jgi:RimJ/RimL family protein N-acetyltransferase